VDCGSYGEDFFFFFFFGWDGSAHTDLNFLIFSKIFFFSFNAAQLAHPSTPRAHFRTKLCALTPRIQPTYFHDLTLFIRGVAGWSS
jgi:hypothetical protein